MSGRKTFVGGDILLASEINGFLMDQAVMVFDDASARDTAIPSPDEGMITYLKDTDALEKRTASAWVNVNTDSGKILQVVRATNTTGRGTTSTSFVDVTGMSVTITPQRSDSAILIWSPGLSVQNNNSDDAVFIQVTDASNNPISGAENTIVYQAQNAGGVGITSATVLAYATPATTSPVTFKLRFKVSAGTGTIRAESTMQLFAIEVAA